MPRPLSSFVGGSLACFETVVAPPPGCNGKLIMLSSRTESSGIVLRDYQERDEERIRAAFRAGRRHVLYVAPTGSGKTILFCDLTLKVLERGKRVLIVCHRHELIEQISEALDKFHIEHGLIVSGVPPRYHHAAQVSSVQSLAVRRLPWQPDLIVIDEAHHTARGNAWARALQDYPDAYRLGVTATPCRADGRPLGEFFREMVVGPSYRELENAGFLTPLEAWAPPLVDMSGSRARGGDYDHGEVVDRAGKPHITGDAIRHYQRLGYGGRAIVFDVSIDTARQRAQSFLHAGIAAEAIDGTQTKALRSGAVSRFRSGATQVLVSVDLVSEGFDLPAIEVGISLRPTLSLALWMQQAGRILRPMAGKSVARLLDHAGNIERHGFPNDSRDWSLDRPVTSRERGKSERGFRICPHCFLASLSGPRFCPACGTPYPIKARQVRQRQGELVKVADDEPARARRASAFKHVQGRARDLPSLIELGKRRGMRHPELWARHVINSRGRPS